MTKGSEAELRLSKRQARRFLLAHHSLWPPRRLKGAAGVMDYIRRVNCVQYDPINVVGQNPHLVLQSRLKAYQSQMLEQLLYEERSLLDGFDKVMSIYPSEDWPQFARTRAKLMERYYPEDYRKEANSLGPLVLQEVAERGPLSSLDLDHKDAVDWAWGPTRAGRAALEMLFLAGEVLVSHRVGTRRYFDLSERLLPEEVLKAEASYSDKESYQDWHVLRRVGGVGLAHAGAGDHWGGMLGMKAGERNTALQRLIDQGEVIQASVEDLEGQRFYLRSKDLPTLERVSGGRQPKAGAAFLAPLDNLMWNRKLVQMLFNFDYVWEVYKPAKKRIYGYYVLPVLYGDRMVGRVHPSFERKTRVLTLQQWWWEEGVDVESDALVAALQQCLFEFGRYLGAEEIVLAPGAAKDQTLRAAISL